MIRLNTPLLKKDIKNLRIGDKVEISGYIFCGRDAVLPKLADLDKETLWKQYKINLEGSVIFHTAVSPAGIGPTSSNKLEIESSMGTLSKAGVKLHLGKGMINRQTVELLDKYCSVFAVVPPVTALFKSNTLEQNVVAFEEEGMEALHLLKVENIPAIIAAVNGKSIYF